MKKALQTPKIPFFRQILGGIFVLLLICQGSSLMAQKTVSGTVKDAADGTPLIGASVIVQGTTTGAVTNNSGSFQVEVPAGADSLTITYYGFEKMTLAIGNQSTFAINLKSEVLATEEVVITALGIEREAKALGYGIQELDGSSVVEAKEANFVNALQGKVAGVQVFTGGSGVGSSSRITIRGETSLSGNNQPLFVVNGIPINNSIGGNGRTQGNLEADYGNGAGEINADDIETISVLKGANATALYGSRAANGVILITTKTGKGKSGIGVSVNSNTTFERPLRIPQYQNEYGQGSNFEFEFVDGFGSGTNDNIDESWGPALDGRLMVQHHSVKADGTRAGDFVVRPGDYSDQDEYEKLPWEAQPTNIEDFFETGVTTTNNIALFGGDATGNFRLSYTNLRSEGILPNTNLRRDNINLDLSKSMLNDKLTFNVNANYINSGSDNRPNNSYGTENIMYLWVWFGRHIPMNTLESYWQPGLEDIQQFNYNYNWHDNPYFTQFENTNAFGKDRLLGNINATYKFTDKLSLMLRTGTDFYNELRTGKRAYSTQRFPRGQYREDKIFWQEMNSDFLLKYDDRLGENISLNVNIGGNHMEQTYRYHLVSANELAIPGVYSFNNSAIPLSSSQFNSRRAINSLYGALSLGINDAIYLDLAARNDWSSTLPADNRSYFYPSASLAIIANELIDLPQAITFAKLRLGWGQVGNDTDPYSLNNFFQFLTTPYGTQLLGTESNVLANSDLLPENAATLEIGADIRLFDNRVGLDVSWFNTNTVNQILQIPVSQTSGYGFRNINAGEINSTGLEAILNITPVRNPSFTWDMNFNFTRYRSEVVSLTEGIEEYLISNNYLQVLAIEGNRMGDLYGTGFKYIDMNTKEQVTVTDINDIQDSYRVLYSDNGQPERDPTLRNLGNYNPDWTLGIYNTFRIKNFRLGFLFDGRYGGVIKSRTLLIGSTSGMMAETAEFNRETHQFIGDGVKAVRNSEGVITDYVENDIAISARDFYWSHFNRGNEQMGMYDASFIKLRELKIGYDFPSSVANAIRAEKLSLSLVGRNLLLWTENPHFDPEVFSFNANTPVPGVEDMATPTSRSMGVNLNITF